MVAPKTKGASRVRYHDGQLLASRDLRDDVDHEARLRGLHVRALHGVWGIALGYEVLPVAGDKLVSVTQGMAYDCAGREIVLSDTLALTAPQGPRASAAPAWWFDLLIRAEQAERGASAPARSCPEAAPGLAGGRLAWRWSCAGEAPTPFVTAPGFAEDVRLGEEIPLARVRITRQQEFREIDFTVRRVARGLVRPYIAGGQLRQASVAIEGSPWHWKARVDTLPGGFSTARPAYFASLANHPWLHPSSGFAALASGLPALLQRQLLGPFISIEAPSRTGFTLDVRMAVGGADVFATVPAASHQSAGLYLPVAVNWIGMEANGGCQPPLEAGRVHWAGNLLSLAQFRKLARIFP